MFVKVFSQIFDSSIADDYELRHFFTDLLVLAELDGVVDMTPEAIAARTRIPLTLVNQHLVQLQSPDPRSRTPECEGRRLVPLDPQRNWGWKIVNYQMYRDIRDDTERRAYMRDYMRNYRNKQHVNSCKQSLTSVNSCKPVLAKAEAEAEAEAEAPRSRRSGISLEKAKQQSEIQAIGIPIEFVEHCWNKCESRGWLDSKGIGVGSFFGFVRTEWKYELDRKHREKLLGNGRPQAEQKTILQKNAERNLREAERLYNEPL